MRRHGSRIQSRRIAETYLHRSIGTALKGFGGTPDTSRGGRWALSRGLPDRRAGRRAEFDCGGLPASLIARIKYEQGQLDEAEAWVIDRASLISSGTMLDCVVERLFRDRQGSVLPGMNFERARTLLERAENLGVARDWGSSRLAR